MSHIEPVDLLPEQTYLSAVMTGFLEKISLEGKIEKENLPPKSIIPEVDEFFSDAIKGLKAIKGEAPQIPKYLTTYKLIKDLINKSESLPYGEKEILNVRQIVEDYAEFNKILNTPRTLNEKDKELTKSMLKFFETLSQRANSAQYVNKLYREKSKYTYVF